MKTGISIDYKFRIGDAVQILNHVTLKGARGRVHAQINRALGREYRVTVGEQQHTIAEGDLRRTAESELYKETEA